MPTATVPQVQPSHKSDQIRVISRRRQPWAWFDKRVITRYGRQLGPHGIAVYMALTVHADGELQTCFPSYQTIARQIGVSQPTVLKAIKLLLALALIEKQAMQSPDGDPGPNLYTLLDIPATLPMELAPAAGPPAPDGVVKDVDHPSQPALPPVVNDVSPNKNLLERDLQNQGNGQRLHVEGAQHNPIPTSYGRRGYTPLTREQLAERKALLRQQALMLAQGGP